MIVAKKAPQRLPEYHPYTEEKPHVRPKRKPGENALLYLTLFLVLVAALFAIAQYSHMVSLSYRITRAESELKALSEEKSRLQVEIARLNSLERIEAIAVEELGMQYPENGQWRVLAARQD